MKSRLQVLLDDNCIKMVKMTCAHFNISLSKIANDALRAYVIDLLMRDDEYYEFAKTLKFDEDTSVCNSIRMVGEERAKKDSK